MMLLQYQMVNTMTRYLRHGPVQQKRKRNRGVSQCSSEQEIHSENSDHAFLISDSSYRDYKSVDCGRQKERLHVLDFLEREHSLYYKETRSSSGYSSEKFGDGHIWAADNRHSRWRSRQCFRDQIDPRIERKWDEREYCHEISDSADNVDEMDRNYIFIINEDVPGGSFEIILPL